MKQEKPIKTKSAKSCTRRTKVISKCAVDINNTNTWSLDPAERGGIH